MTTKRPGYSDLEMIQKRQIAAYQETIADMTRTIARLRAVLGPLFEQGYDYESERCFFCQRRGPCDPGCATERRAELLGVVLEDAGG